jgi:hypothetical protein
MIPYNELNDCAALFRLHLVRIPSRIEAVSELATNGLRPIVRSNAAGDLNDHAHHLPNVSSEPASARFYQRHENPLHELHSTDPGSGAAADVQGESK